LAININNFFDRFFGLSTFKIMKKMQRNNVPPNYKDIKKKGVNYYVFALQ